MNKNSTKTYFVTNTKGGVGKTTFALHVLPVMAHKKGFNKINYYQLDDNNNLTINSEAVKIKNYKITKTEDVIDSIELDIDLENEIVNIIDIGGGNDTKDVLEYLKRNGDDFVNNITFFVPTDNDLQHTKNLTDTLELIQDTFKDAEIILVLNGVNDMNAYKEEFINIFGDEVYNIKSIVDIVDSKCNEMIMVKRDNIFQVMGFNQITLLDAYLDAKDVNSKAKELKKQYALEYEKDNDMDAYQVKKRKLRFAKRVIDTVDEFKEI